ncbi:glucan biosynthesis protein G [Hyphomicrobium sp.]|uniref:glucan biosynthesis protein n=1 Tax=Hyphomicrobium sp. TaxID=82 RepID=UPI0025B83F3F|nr:glucan biosynthesis protein G [Hyphomicrobium sp.]MCC7253389.1 glucan biosynthesis protein [Hyphomicrobium sp.]
MKRRTFLTSGLSALALMRAPETVRAAVPFSGPDQASSSGNQTAARVRELARELSRRRFAAPAERAPGALQDLDYDQYRELRFRSEKALWHNEDLGFEIQLFPAAYIFRSPVSIFLVERGRSRRLKPNASFFDFGPYKGRIPRGAQIDFSGFRIHAPINRRDHHDEFLVFQGASYFRGLGKDHRYGLSARGLALHTAGAEAEEFPFFRSFWIERPDTPQSITVHALLDSPSVTGAYTFVIRPGRETLMDITSVLFPRRDLTNVGIAPLTSMFLKAAHDPHGPLDFRPSVHDSDGLAVWNGRDERLWRPLLSPSTFQVSAFVDHNPRGFGLIQRERRFDDYQDLEAFSELRPSAWVTPGEGWGAGSVELVEIPTDVEYEDNIVAYWRPDAPLRAGGSYSFSYRLAWCDDVPASSRMRVRDTRVGAGSGPGAIRFVVDFADNRALERLADSATILRDASPTAFFEADLTASAGTLRGPYVQPNPHLPGTRVVFELDPGQERVVEMRLALSAQGEPMSETWLYRWCA